MKIEVTPPVVVPSATLHLSNKELVVLAAALSVVLYSDVVDRLRDGTTLGKMASGALLDTSHSSVREVLNGMFNPLMAALSEVAKDA